MNVADFIAALRALPPDAEVLCADDYGDPPVPAAAYERAALVGEDGARPWCVGSSDAIDAEVEYRRAVGDPVGARRVVVLVSRVRS